MTSDLDGSMQALERPAGSQGHPNADPGAGAGAATAADPREHRRQTVVCRACEQLITDLSQRIEVQDAHQHRFMNPGGFLFHIGCFAQAIGCRVIGPDSWEYPWFPGFAWRCAHCGGCGRQLGWSFRNPDAAPGARSSFFGLVLDRLKMHDHDD